MCDTLRLSYTELEKQPTEWLKLMLDYYTAKSTAERYKSKIKK